MLQYIYVAPGTQPKHNDELSILLHLHLLALLTPQRTAVCPFALLLGTSNRRFPGRFSSTLLAGSISQAQVHITVKGALETETSFSKACPKFTDLLITYYIQQHPPPLSPPPTQAAPPNSNSSETPSPTSPSTPSTPPPSQAPR